MLDATCLFCKIRDKQLPSHIIYEDTHTLAFLTIGPINPGHALIIPKKHTQDLHTADTETLQHLLPATQKDADAITKATNAEGITIGINNGKAGGQAVFHLHVHVMPRFTNDGYKHWEGKEASQEALKEIAEKIRKSF